MKDKILEALMPLVYGLGLLVTAFALGIFLKGACILFLIGWNLIGGKI